MTTIYLIVSGVIVLAAVYFVMASIARAPEGFEDENGFHLKSENPVVAASAPAVVVAVVPSSRSATRSPSKPRRVVPDPDHAHAVAH